MCPAGRVPGCVISNCFHSLTLQRWKLSQANTEIADMTVVGQSHKYIIKKIYQSCDWSSDSSSDLLNQAIRSQSVSLADAGSAGKMSQESTHLPRSVFNMQTHISGEATEERSWPIFWVPHHLWQRGHRLTSHGHTDMSLSSWIKMTCLTSHDPNNTLTQADGELTFWF